MYIYLVYRSNIYFHVILNLYFNCLSILIYMYVLFISFPALHMMSDAVSYGSYEVVIKKTYEVSTYLNMFSNSTRIPCSIPQ